jgi:hypothetical protein
VTPHVLLQLALCDKRFEALVTRELAVFLLVSAYVIVEAHPTVQTYDKRMLECCEEKSEFKNFKKGESQNPKHNLFFQRPFTRFCVFGGA